jgi:hypothetical protein
LDDAKEEFSIVQFFERVKHFPEANRGYWPKGPRYFGLALNLIGVVALLVSIRQYQSTMRCLWGANFAPLAGFAEPQMRTPLLAVALKTTSMFG